MATTSSLFMYSLTIQAPTAFTQAILGQFSGTKEQQIITASGSVLTLHRPDPQQGRVQQIISHDVFGIIRTIAAFRLAGSTKDYIIIGSDSGRIAIVEYIPDQRRFKRVHLETFGKSGIRRVVPGQYLAVDPKGRACFLASVEKNKLVYVLNRNAQAELTISSPLEAHKPQTLVFALCALDVGYENPIFAALEVDYGDSDQDPSGQAFRETDKQLVYYELDLGLNHVVRKWADVVDRTANLLLQVPGGSDGPSGILVCAEDSITYQHNNQDGQRVPIPRRRGATEDLQRKRHIVAGVTHKMKGAFFSLVQTEDGDLFKVTLELIKSDQGAATGEVAEMKIDYFDTVPVASSLLILKSGYLLVASESGDHQLYQFDKLGEHTGTETSSKDYSIDAAQSYEPVYFHPRAAENISLTDSVNAMNPMTACKVANLTDDDAPQLYSICGTGARSSFKSLRNGLEVTEIAETEMPGAPLAVWATKANRDAEHDKYVVISFSDATLILEVGDNIEEAEDTGFLKTTPTLAIQLLGEDALVQVHSRGIRLILPGGRINDWPAPQHRTIVAAATNEAQVVVALSSGEIVYFEKDDDGELAEYEERREMSGTVTSLSIGDVPEGRQRSPYLAVGCNDCTVRILSLDLDSTLENKSVQALSSAPSALSIMPMADSSSGGSALYLHIGLNSGVYLRTVLDEVTGELSDTRTRFLGPKEIKLFRVTAQDQPAVLALSSRPWLGYSDPQTKAFMLTPLSYVPLEWGWSFNSEQSAHGMVGVQGQSLRIFHVEKLTSNILQESIPLAYTPRDLVRHPDKPYFYVIEADNNVLSSASTLRLQNDPSVVNGDAEVLPPEVFGYPKGRHHWASCIQVVDPITEKQITHTIDLEDNEAAVSVACVPFDSQDGEVFLVVGTGKGMVMMPRSHQGGFIHVYRISDSGRTLEFIHKSPTADPPLALLGFQGRLLAGIGTLLYIFDLGIKQMIRKARNNVVPRLIVGLQSQGSRIIVSDISESITYVVFKSEQNMLLPFADDTLTRWTTCATMVDYTSVAGGDKFGNLWLVRCPQAASDGADEPGAATYLTHERGYLQGTPNRLELVAHFFPNDIPTSIHKCQLVAGGRDVILWSGLAGTIGVLIPFVTRDDVDFFQSLEQHLRSEDPPLAGRDHLAYRGYYVPVKGMIDGDLCERYQSLTMDKKISIAGELERSVREVERKVQDMRSRAAY